MKERYVKPEFYMESFALSQSIAKFCEAGIRAGTWYGKPLHYSDTSCAWDTGADFNLFHNSCDFNMDEGEWEGICYNNPGDSTPLFAS